MKRTYMRKILTASAVIMLLAIGSSAAFFTDMGSVTNSFTVGNISILLEEPGWEPENGKDITPNETIAKDPRITNDGANEAYVFMKVKLPTAVIKTAGPDGSINAAAKHELFSYDVNEGWIQIEKKTEDHKAVYVYAYVGDDGNMKSLEPGSATGPVFDSVIFINAVEGQLEDDLLTIDVDAMGIQTGDIKSRSPADVYSLLNNGSM